VTQFALKLMLTALVGGSWVVVSTIIAERAGTKLGGVVAGLPSSSLMAFLFIGWTQSPEAAAQATTLAPLTMGVVALFNVVYALLYPKGFVLALASALGVWFVLALGLLALNVNNYALSLLGLIVLLVLCYWTLEKVLNIPSEGQRRMRYTPGQLAFRGLMGGTIISFAVLMARVGGPLVGGVFATFPNVMLSTMIVNHLNHGRAFSTAVIKAMTVSGAITVTLYVTAVRYLYPASGLILGTALSFALSLLSGYLVYRFVQTRMT
jgi:uncharacterized membrane protein (GlpM family)